MSDILVNTLEKNSRILKLKSKFFIYRFLTYAIFLLVPVWVQRSLHLPLLMQMLLMILYLLFMTGQWFLLGKEIDHRLKIYYRVNSSLDRPIYRLFMGALCMVLYFQFLAFLPLSWLKHFFWGTWVVLGLFYSWPTRGKIIEESMSGQLSEFKFLDSFEKTLLILVLVFLLISVPRPPPFESIDALKLYFDPMEKMGHIFWNFLGINYFPFRKSPHLLKLAYWVYFYFFGIGLFLLALYACIRTFLSRRLSILGVFSVVSAWPFYLIIDRAPGPTFISTYFLLWLWSSLWAVKSSTYRSGLLIGLIGLWGMLLNLSFCLLIPLQVLVIYTFYLKGHTLWFRNQWFKYTTLGLGIMMIMLLLDARSLDLHWDFPAYFLFWEQVKLVGRKAFFALAPLGLLLTGISFCGQKIRFLRPTKFNFTDLSLILLSIVSVLIFSLFLYPEMLTGLTLLWMAALFGLIPLEWIFQSINKLRSRRNFIYAVYIIICLLDSHFEGRIKNLVEIFY